MNGDICVCVCVCVISGNTFFATTLEDDVFDYLSTCYSLIHWSFLSLNWHDNTQS